MSIDLAIRSLLKEVVREVVREEMGSDERAGSNAEFLTYAEAGELAHVSVATIKRWVRDERLRAFGEGRVRRVKSGDVRQCLEGRQRPTASVNSKVSSILAGVRGQR